jgi:hypothetical protein
VSPVRTVSTGSADSDFTLRTAYLAEALAAMYPPPYAAASVDVVPQGPLVARFRLVPDARRPRLLVPVASDRVAAAAARRYVPPPARLAGLRWSLAILALRTGVASLLLRDHIQVAAPRDAGAPDTIDRYLRESLGQELVVSVHIGGMRAGRKPVLHLLTPLGDTIGFAKLGITPLTRQLVRAETIALATLNHLRLRHVQAPRVLHAGQWREHEVLVQQALPVWARRVGLPAPRLAEAMRELAWSVGVTREPLAGSPYWKALRGRLSAPPGPGRGDAAALTLAADELVARAGDIELTFGAWHGDWTPWNTAAVANRLLVWGWERFAHDVPVGFDALHHDLLVRLARGTDAGAAVDGTLRRAPALLAPFGVTEPEQARLTSLVYLVDLAARYLADRHAEAGARVGVPGNSLLPALIRVATVERFP